MLAGQDSTATTPHASASMDLVQLEAVCAVLAGLDQSATPHQAAARTTAVAMELATLEPALATLAGLVLTALNPRALVFALPSLILSCSSSPSYYSSKQQQ